MTELHPGSCGNSSGKWHFWIDRGGTFTDIVAVTPDGVLKTHKLLSSNAEHYADAALQGIRDLLRLAPTAPVPAERIAVVKMGTTVATNALLERKGEPTVLAITRGFRDALRIGDQARPQLFARHIVRPELLYARVVEIDERIDAHDRIVQPLDADGAGRALQVAYDDGLRSVAIVFMHGYRNPQHEQACAAIAAAVGFTRISVSHQVSPLIKLVGRGETTVVDAYLSPILHRYTSHLAAELGSGVKLMFMQSNGGLTAARQFQGKDAILSGPAGGVVGAVAAGEAAGCNAMISFDMGGTSTDVSLCLGTARTGADTDATASANAVRSNDYGRSLETRVAGVRLRAPMLHIHTVAAGGGSVCSFTSGRYRVGPDSAGADPGPACYGKGGPLTVTDCNVMLGKVQPQHFPAVFGPHRQAQLDRTVVQRKLAALQEELQQATGEATSLEAIAAGFLQVATENMANAVKTISVQRGCDVTQYTLCAFGGAAGQHACMVAAALGITRVLFHPLAGVLSAYGMGQAAIRALREHTLEVPLGASLADQVLVMLDRLGAAAKAEVANQGIATARIEVRQHLHLRYDGTDTCLAVTVGDAVTMACQFAVLHRCHYGFVMPDKPLIVAMATAEAIGYPEQPPLLATGGTSTHDDLPPPLEVVTVHMAGDFRPTPVYARDALGPGMAIQGPALVCEAVTTTVVEPGWRAVVTERGDLLLERVAAVAPRLTDPRVDPVMLEVFNNRFRTIAEQMGITLQRTASSVNIKERLDFSCAVFDPAGNLVANAPHLPVHLGSMADSVRAVIATQGAAMAPGDVFVLNSPYLGGTHLPDITVITPVFDHSGHSVLFYVGSRGHHADVGGIAPGSMPPNSRRIQDEGVLIPPCKVVAAGAFREQAVRGLLTASAHPARNPDQNVADLKAQIAANERGSGELRQLVEHYGLTTVLAAMAAVQANAAEAVRCVIDGLSDGSFVYPLDNGATIAVAVTIDHRQRRARVDFTGTTAQLDNNFNAPLAITTAAVLYVFRTLVDEDIPLNQGCLEPVDIVVPQPSMLAPAYPAAVVAGNVETSQAVTDTIFGALGVMAAAQGTMNNLSFGNATYQYYETIGGGSGAGPGFHGASAVQTHMTNSHLTDPEVLESRFPVLLECFEIRSGSGGRGQYRGGDGARRRLRFLEPMEVMMLANRRQVPPYGLAGGSSGKVGCNWLERANGERLTLSGCDRAQAHSGDVFVVETPGGGGFGPVTGQ